MGSRSPDGSADASDPVPAPLSSATGSYLPGTIAVAHAALTRRHPLGEIPADSIGGFLYTGGPIRLTDFSDRSARYAAPAGIQLQGWLRVIQTGRYQNAPDLQLRLGEGAIFTPLCTFSARLEESFIGSEIRSVESWCVKGEPVALSGVLGAELQPRLHKLCLWIVCVAPSAARSGES